MLVLDKQGLDHGEPRWRPRRRHCDYKITGLTSPLRLRQSMQIKALIQSFVKPADPNAMAATARTLLMRH
jgi:hypothetical protein